MKTHKLLNDIKKKVAPSYSKLNPLVSKLRPLAKRLPKPKLASKIVAAILLGLSFFQLMLLLGAPMGAAAFGGQYDVLPANLRALCVSTIVVYFITSYAIRSRAGLTKTPSNDQLIVFGTWLATAIFLFSALANAISFSIYENFIMAPLALILSGLTFIVARQKVTPSK